MYFNKPALIGFGVGFATAAVVYYWFFRRTDISGVDRYDRMRLASEVRDEEVVKLRQEKQECYDINLDTSQKLLAAGRVRQELETENTRLKGELEKIKSRLPAAQGGGR